MKTILFLFLFLSLNDPLLAQLKFVVEDFEGFADGTSDLKLNGVFTYGNIKANVEYQTSIQQSYAGDRFLSLYKPGSQMGSNGNTNYCGWGKGLGVNVELYDVNNAFVTGNTFGKSPLMFGLR